MKANPQWKILLIIPIGLLFLARLDSRRGGVEIVTVPAPSTFRAPGPAIDLDPLYTRQVPAPTAGAAIEPPRDSTRDLETVAELEARYQRGELTGGYTIDGQDLVSVSRDGKTSKEAFPAGIHEQGEAAVDAWESPEGSLFVVGYMYTGVPGPDTGAIYQRDPGGRLRLVFSRAVNEIYSVWGTSTNDVYAGGKRTLVHFDGKQWSDVSLDGVLGSVGRLWTNGTQLFVTTHEEATDTSYVYARTDSGPWKAEVALADCGLRAIHGHKSAVWAAGYCGVILHRNLDGSWSEERRQQGDMFADGAIVNDLWAVSETEVYAAASDLLERKADGTWTKAKVPSDHVFALTGSGKDVYALGQGGVVFRSTAKSRFKKLRYANDACELIATQRDRWLCFNERRVPIASSGD